jgi:hypothetical protein
MSRAPAFRRRPPRAALPALALIAVFAAPRTGHAQADAAPAASRPAAGAAGAGAKATDAVLDVRFVSELANAVQPSDTLVAPEASARLRAHLADAPGVTVVDSATLAAALRSPAVVAAAGGRPCGAVPSCLRAVQQATGAGWVAAGKLTKISSLVWIYGGQLMDGSTGRLVMDDEYEVKGVAGDMAEIGTRVFARRAVKKMLGEGAATP